MITKSIACVTFLKRNLIIQVVICININGQYLKHLRYADDIAIIESDLEELEGMLNEPNIESTKIGLKTNINKTKKLESE